MSGDAGPFHDSLPETPEPRASRVLEGHQPILESLLSEDLQGRLHHAHIFAGPSGIGKATTAFHLCRALFERDGGFGEDVVFRQIASGAFPNLLHIARPYDDKGKRFRSVITVDEIRQINSFLGMTASSGGRRCIIIDGAQDMNASAANALLKNLEEPPARTHFFLIAGENGRLLPTIRSRCNLVRFQPLTTASCSAVLQCVGFDGAEATMLSERCDANPRDAIVMARYGGVEIAESLSDLMSKVPIEPNALQTFVKAMTERDRDVQYGLALRLLQDEAKALARLAAKSGSIHLAGVHAERALQMAEDIRIAAAYGIDKKVHLANLIRDVARHKASLTARHMDFA